mmetsp:Transcript_26017/g.32075  ORF Transcript_26017/g.32075 Transcript_26017/m.32075 type:complete len:160 (+) Transcript_26017:65-544(+)
MSMSSIILRQLSIRTSSVSTRMQPLRLSLKFTNTTMKKCCREDLFQSYTNRRTFLTDLLGKTGSSETEKQTDDKKDIENVFVSTHINGTKNEDKLLNVDKEDGKGVEDEDGMEQEDMFVSPDPSLGTSKIEWGGPRRGGRFSEPTRFGDWERKGRCTDF